MQIWDSTDGTPAWKDEPVYPASRMLVDPILKDMHGKYEEAEVCAPAKTGKGDRAGSFQDPSRNKRRHPGYQAKNLGKLIARNNGGYGWSPFA